MTGKRTLLRGSGLIALVCLQAVATATNGMGPSDAYWPCEQVLVPEVSAAVIWDGPAIDEAKDTWRSLPRVAEVVERIASPQASAETAQAAIASFASELEPADKDRMLTALFAGVLEVMNQDRSKLIDGIERYSRDQQRRAEALGEKLDEMVRLEQDDSEAARQALDELMKALELGQRVFDERERFIQYLCARPIVVEQRLGFLARTIAGYLD